MQKPQIDLMPPRMKNLIIASVLAALCFAQAPALAAPVDLAAYPEASVDQAIPEIVDGLRRFLKDPSSIKDFAICDAPAKIKIKDGKPKYWSYLFSVNAKNSFGGYTGLRHYAAIFVPGKPVAISSLSAAAIDGFGLLTNRLIDQSARRCGFIPAERVERLLANR